MLVAAVGLLVRADRRFDSLVRRQRELERAIGERAVTGRASGA
jgi:hypothetical protein